jgi:hypothetical protein
MSVSSSSFTSERDVIAFFIPGESFGFLRRERVVHDFSDAIPTEGDSIRSDVGVEFKGVSWS